MGTKMNVKKGDEVLVIAGKDKGRQGKIQRVFPGKSAVLVEGLNLAKKHAKPTKTNPQGGVIDKALPIEVSKVMVVCPGCNKPTRILREQSTDGEFVRSCRHCGRNLE